MHSFSSSLLTSKLIIKLTILCLMIPNAVPNALAQTNDGTSIPNDFFYQNQPIDPFCVSKLANIDQTKAEPVNIDECSKHKEVEFENINEQLTKNKFFGFDYKEKLPTGYMAHGYNYYKYLGKIDNLHILYSIQNGGGSGEFTALFLARRTGNYIHLAKMIAYGDRCNGGLSDVSVKDKKILYSQALTPFDLVSLSNKKSEKLQAYEDLASCAVCCIAKGIYEYSDDQSKLTSILINKDAGNNNASVQGKFQPCFDQLIKEYKANSKDKLTLPELDEFVAKFNETCVKH